MLQLTDLKIARLLILLGSFLLAAQAYSAEPKPFDKNSLKAIEASYEGQAFMLSIWSLDCPPCFEELELLGRLRAEGQQFNLVLLSTDAPDTSALAADFLAHFGLAEEDSWIYGNSRSEQLRYSVDPNWYGEMPRSYFYDAEGVREAMSGLLSEELLQAWIDSLRAGAY